MDNNCRWYSSEVIQEYSKGTKVTPIPWAAKKLGGFKLRSVSEIFGPLDSGASKHFIRDLTDTLRFVQHQETFVFSAVLHPGPGMDIRPLRSDCLISG